MKRKPRQWFALLALALLIAGAGLVLLGLAGSRRGAVQPTMAMTPALAAAPSIPPPLPTATEPILPPPPTATGSANHLTATRPLPTKPAAEAASRTPAASTVPSRSPTPSTQPALLFSPSPTALPMPAHTQAATRRPDPSPFSTVLPSTPPAIAVHGAYSPQSRLGVCASGPNVDHELAERLGFGWYLDWRVSPAAFRSETVEYMPMIRLYGGQPSPNGAALLAAVDAMPGALWLIGNEPDVKWQDNVAPELYARLYHDLYAQLKERDPTCRVAIGGVSQPTPLRLRYLDRILDAYEALYGQPMPVDVWNVHNFILREELDSWGVDIPPGMPDRTGDLHEIADHDDLVIFRWQILDFRRWMAERGQRDKALLITEYGILMPADYGFPPDEVKGFMLDTFEFLRTATDPALGYSADGNRLVQRWCWYSLWDERYPTGNLLQSEGGALTPLGGAFAEYAHSRP